MIFKKGGEGEEVFFSGDCHRVNVEGLIEFESPQAHVINEGRTLMKMCQQQGKQRYQSSSCQLVTKYKRRNVLLPWRDPGHHYLRCVNLKIERPFKVRSKGYLFLSHWPGRSLNNVLMRRQRQWVLVRKSRGAITSTGKKSYKNRGSVWWNISWDDEICWFYLVGITTV